MVKLVERLRDVLTRYQVSEGWFFASNATYTVGQISQQQAMYEQQQTIREQQQTIYDQITNLTVRVFWLVFIVYTDQSCHQVFFQLPLEVSRSDAVH